MSASTFSVVIPAYNQAAFLGDAIRSVLGQTYPHFEVIVVDDASSDDPERAVREFDDPRVRYIAHQVNLRLPATRNTGIRAARGNFVAFLDADDFFHPDKLKAHVEFLETHPDVDVTYNARFELNHSATTVRELWWPPSSVELTDLILGFPFAPSDMVTRRQRLLDVGLFNPDMGSAEDTDLPCRLMLEGCRFAGVGRALNYRRHHSGRGRKNLMGRRNDVARAIDAVFADARCPAVLAPLRGTSLTHHLMVLVSLALVQEEIGLATDFADELVRRDPAVLQGHPCSLASFLMMESVADASLDHERLLRQIFSRLPASLGPLSGQLEWAVSRGYVWKGLRHMLWERADEGAALLARAPQPVAIDEPFVQFLTSHLLNHEKAFGLEAALAALDRLSVGLRLVNSRRKASHLKGSFLVNTAFTRFHAREFKGVPRTVARAILSEPSYLANRGVISMMVRSLLQG